MIIPSSINKTEKMNSNVKSSNAILVIFTPVYPIKIIFWYTNSAIDKKVIVIKPASKSSAPEIELFIIISPIF